MIRTATYDDVPALLALGEAMHTESRYAALPWDAAKVSALIESLIESPDGLAMVAVRDGEIVGGFLGSIDEHYFSRARVACDYALFVRPDRRGGLLAIQLLEAYVGWAKVSGAALIQAGITTGVNVDAASRLFAVAGFAGIGPLFEYQEPAHG